MAYTPQEWRNDDETTPLSAGRLTHIEDGISGAHGRLDDLPTPVDGDDGVTPHIGENGNWFLGTEDTGTPARGPAGQDGTDGQNGVTPHIGDNGNWHIGDTDTGTPARGPAGQDGTDGTDGADGFPSEADWNALVARVEALEGGGA